MKLEINIQELRKLCSDEAEFSPEILDWIAKENLWNLWIPKTYGGLELYFSEGLKKLKSLAKIDGSLGWTITLCSGANYFIGNLQPEVAREIFLKPEIPVRFGGSGGVFGTADKHGDSYRISGTWRYATGAPYLTHFTLNAKILENGEEIKNKDGLPEIRSFVVHKKDVQVIEDWNTMGLKASATHSFVLRDVLVHKNYSFLYNHCNLYHPIFKIHFSLFADLTLWVNYIGMAEHFLEEAQSILTKEQLNGLTAIILIANQETDECSNKIEDTIENGLDFTETFLKEIHDIAVTSVHNISTKIISIYPFLGVRASRENEPLNQIFRDYFTATQHHNFTKK